VACLSPGPNYFGIDSVRDIVRYGDRPILLVSPANERQRSDILGRSARNATVKVIDGVDLHGTFMFGKVPGIEKTVFDFVNRHIGKPAEHPVLASIRSRKYHKPTCRYVQTGSSGRYVVKPENLRVFSSAVEAEARGYKPCKPCHRTKSR